MAATKRWTAKIVVGEIADQTSGAITERMGDNDSVKIAKDDLEPAELLGKVRWRSASLPARAERMGDRFGFPPCQPASRQPGR